MSGWASTTSGVLKNAIDYLSGEWNNKAAAFVSYGSLGEPKPSSTCPGRAAVGQPPALTYELGLGRGRGGQLRPPLSRQRTVSASTAHPGTVSTTHTPQGHPTERRITGPLSLHVPINES